MPSAWKNFPEVSCLQASQLFSKPIQRDWNTQYHIYTLLPFSFHFSILLLKAWSTVVSLILQRINIGSGACTLGISQSLASLYPSPSAIRSQMYVYKVTPQQQAQTYRGPVTWYMILPRKMSHKPSMNSHVVCWQDSELNHNPTSPYKKRFPMIVYITAQSFFCLSSYCNRKKMFHFRFRRCQVLKFVCFKCFDPHYIFCTTIAHWLQLQWKHKTPKSSHFLDPPPKKKHIQKNVLTTKQTNLKHFNYIMTCLLIVFSLILLISSILMSHNYVSEHLNSLPLFWEENSK